MTSMRAALPLIALLLILAGVPSGRCQDYGKTDKPFDVGVPVGYYVVDGMGNVYYNGDPTLGRRFVGVFFGDDLVEDIEVYLDLETEEIGLWMLDEYGQIYAPQALEGTNPAPVNFRQWGTPFAPDFGIPIARDLEATPSYHGLFILAGDGRVATVGDADQTKALAEGMPYFGLDLAVDLEVVPDPDHPGRAAGLLMMDQYGGIHTTGVATAVVEHYDQVIPPGRSVYLPFALDGQPEPYDAMMLDLELYMTGEPIEYTVHGSPVTSYVRGYWQLDAYGGVHTIGEAGRYDFRNPAAGAYFPFNIAGALEPILRRSGDGAFEYDAYFLLDRYGGIHPFGELSNRFGITELEQNHYLAFDMVRDVELARSLRLVPTPQPTATFTLTPTMTWTPRPTATSTLSPSVTPTYTRTPTRTPTESTFASRPVETEILWQPEQPDGRASFLQRLIDWWGNG